MLRFRGPWCDALALWALALLLCDRAPGAGGLGLERLARQTWGMQLPCPPLTFQFSGEIPDQLEENRTDLDIVHVVYAANAAGFAGLLTSMVSLAQHLREPSTVVIHVVVPTGDMPKIGDVLACFANETASAGVDGKAVRVKVHDMLPQPALSGLGGYPPEAFVRLYLHRYLPQAPRALWIDIDTVILADITPLYHMRLKHALAASLDGGLAGMQKATRNLPNVSFALAQLTGRDWLNTGVMVYDLAKWRAHGPVEALEQTIQAFRGWSAEQLAFSVLFRGRVDLFNWRWNVHGLSDDIMPKRCLPEARIIHWTGRRGGKPWKMSHAPFNDWLFKEYGPRHSCSALANV